MEGPDLARILQSVFGIGLVVFVHELGHFIAARLCGVRVETFSLGFGPRLLGWRRGATMYQLALVPLGGYCRMAGEERRYDGLPPAPDELPAKSVGQRFFIYVAGVAMNVAFVLVLFPILFRIGVPFLEPVVGDVRPGGPAWSAGVRPGETVVAVNGNEVFEFSQIRTEIALGDADRAELLLRDEATGAERVVEVVPEREPTYGLWAIGIEPGVERDERGRPRVFVEPGSPAEAAGLSGEVALVDVAGTDPWLDPLARFAQAASRGGVLELTVEDAEGVRTVVLEPRLVEAPVRRVGIRPPTQRVAGARSTPLTNELGLRAEDRVLAVGGEPVLRGGDFRRALLARVGEPVEVELRRDGAPRTLAWRPLSEDEVHALADDLALGIDEETTRIVVQPGEPAATAGLRDGDRVRQVDGVDTRAWSDVFELVKAGSDAGRPVAFSIERPDPQGGAPLYTTIEVMPASPDVPTYGVGFRRAEYVHRADSAGEALRFGFYSSWKLLNELWLTLKGLVTADVPAENLGGIITIGRVTYLIAESGWTKFLFFLCFLSMNLAFINLLPIPVLDGGHLFFLIVEKIKGSPVSERVLGYSQMVGVVLILSLLIYVTYNDLERLFRAG